MTQELLLECEPLIKAIAKNFYNVEQEDLLQAGRLGLYNAYQHYKQSETTKFSSFAYTYIFGEMYNYTQKSKSIKQNRDTLKLLKIIEKAKHYLTQTLNKIPTTKDIATYLELDEELINTTLISNNSILSLDNPYSDNQQLYNIVEQNYDNDTRIDLEQSIQKLSKEEQEIIKYRYFNDLTQQETAKILNMSQVKVSRYEKKSLNTLQKVLKY